MPQPQQQPMQQPAQQPMQQQPMQQPMQQPAQQPMQQPAPQQQVQQQMQQMQQPMQQPQQPQQMQPQTMQQQFPPQGQGQNQNVDVSNLLSDFGNADPTAASGGASKILAEGDHLVRIQEIKFKPSNRDNNTYFIVEFELVQSVCPGLTLGATYGWSHNLNNKWYGIPNAKQFLAAALGLHPRSPDAMKLDLPHLYEAMGKANHQSPPKPGPEQPLTGRLVWLRTTPGESNNGKYVKHRWAPFFDGVAADFS